MNIIAQNFDIYEGDGLDSFARTGQISLNQLHRVGAEGVILGHSEVGDSPEVVNKKLLMILKRQKEDPSFMNKITVLVGESWEEFKGNSQDKVADIIKKKCEIIFNGIPREFLSNMIIGYEPKWGSKGSGRDEVSPPEPKLISLCIKKMREFFKEEYGDAKIYFIYGGRSSPERTKDILSDENVDGLILGSACNSIRKTLDIANTIKNVGGSKKKVLICNFKAYELEDSYDDYISALDGLGNEFIIQLAPPYIDIRFLKTKTHK